MAQQENRLVLVHNVLSLVSKLRGIVLEQVLVQHLLQHLHAAAAAAADVTS